MGRRAKKREAQQHLYATFDEQTENVVVVDARARSVFGRVGNLISSTGRAIANSGRKGAVSRRRMVSDLPGTRLFGTWQRMRVRDHGMFAKYKPGAKGFKNERQRIRKLARAQAKFERFAFRSAMFHHIRHGRKGGFEEHYRTITGHAWNADYFERVFLRGYGDIFGAMRLSSELAAAATIVEKATDLRFKNRIKDGPLRFLSRNTVEDNQGVEAEGQHLMNMINGMRHNMGLPTFRSVKVASVDALDGLTQMGREAMYAAQEGKAWTSEKLFGESRFAAAARGGLSRHNPRATYANDPNLRGVQDSFNERERALIQRYGAELQAMIDHAILNGANAADPSALVSGMIEHFNKHYAGKDGLVQRIWPGDRSSRVAGGDHAMGKTLMARAMTSFEDMLADHNIDRERGIRLMAGVMAKASSQMFTPPHPRYAPHGEARWRTGFVGRIFDSPIDRLRDRVRGFWAGPDARGPKAANTDSGEPGSYKAAHPFVGRTSGAPRSPDDSSWVVGEVGYEQRKALNEAPLAETKGVGDLPESPLDGPNSDGRVTDDAGNPGIEEESQASASSHSVPPPLAAEAGPKVQRLGDLRGQPNYNNIPFGEWEKGVPQSNTSFRGETPNQTPSPARDNSQRFVVDGEVVSVTPVSDQALTSGVVDPSNDVGGGGLISTEAAAHRAEAGSVGGLADPNRDGFVAAFEGGLNFDPPPAQSRDRHGGVILRGGPSEKEVPKRIGDGASGSLRWGAQTDDPVDIIGRRAGGLGNGLVDHPTSRLANSEPVEDVAAPTIAPGGRRWGASSHPMGCVLPIGYDPAKDDSSASEAPQVRDGLGGTESDRAPGQDLGGLS